MRTIKFRAWDGKYMDYDVLVNSSGAFGEPDIKYNTPNTEINKYPDNTIIMQFTGLHDKNGKEIYEGDVVNWGMHHPNSEEIFHRYAIVEFNPDIQFKIIFYINSQNGNRKETDGHIFRFGQFAYKDTEKHLQVLGNIYENPELLTD